MAASPEAKERQREYDRQYYLRNKEKKKVQHKEWYETNKENGGVHGEMVWQNRELSVPMREGIGLAQDILASYVDCYGEGLHATLLNTLSRKQQVGRRKGVGGLSISVLTVRNGGLIVK